MTIFTRRILYIIAFIFFFIAGPIITYYAAGYRFNLANLTINKVGAYYIKSFPADAFITIDNIETKKQTPSRILNIQPGFHTVTVHKNGFKPWTKQLEINPGETTFIRDIVLFKEFPIPEKIIDNITQSITSDDDQFIGTVTSNDTMVFINTETSNTFETTLPVGAHPAKFSPDNTLLAFTTTSTLSLFNIESEVVTEIVTSVHPIHDIDWDPVDSDLLYFLSDGTLYRSSIVDKSKEVILDTVEQYIFFDRQLYLISKHNEALLLSQFDPFDQKMSWSVSIPATHIIRMDKISDLNSLILQTESSILAVNLDSREITSLDALDYDILDTKILTATEFELALYGVDLKKQLIDRTAQSISLIRWHPSGSYFVQMIGDLLEVVEIDDRDIRNSISITNKTKPVNLVFTNDGKQVYVMNSDSVERYTLQ